jgi:hypothetical protein
MENSPYGAHATSIQSRLAARQELLSKFPAGFDPGALTMRQLRVLLVEYEHGGRQYETAQWAGVDVKTVRKYFALPEFAAALDWLREQRAATRAHKTGCLDVLPHVAGGASSVLSGEDMSSRCSKSRRTSGSIHFS